MKLLFKSVTSKASLGNKPELTLSSMPLDKVRCSFTLFVMLDVLGNTVLLLTVNSTLAWLSCVDCPWA